MSENGEFLHGEKVLVTGGAGLIGSAFVDKLLGVGAEVRTIRHEQDIPRADDMEIVDGDLLNYETCRRACQGVNTVIHAAGVSGGSKRVTVAAIPMYTDNLLMSSQMLKAAQAAGADRYLYISNSSVYPKSDGMLSEADAYNGFPENETGLVKRAGETQCALYAKFTDIRIAVMRAGNAFGPHDNFDLESSHVVPALIRKAVEKQTPYRVWGDGTAVRDFIHTSDIAEGGLFLLEHHPIAEPVNTASGRTVNIRELAEMIIEIAGHDGAELEFDPSAPPASPAKRIDVSRMKALGFQPILSLEEGLARTIDWYRRNGGFEA